MGEGGVELKGEWCHLHTSLCSHTPYNGLQKIIYKEDEHQWPQNGPLWNPKPWCLPTLSGLYNTYSLAPST